MRSRVTSVDVAREAGVSRATVSYVLNNAPGQTIPDETRQRVLDAAKKLGYAPSAAARTLRKGRSDVVLYVLPGWPIGPALGESISLLTAELMKHGLTLLSFQELPGTASFADLWRTIAPAAVIVHEPFSAEEDAALRAAGIEVFSFTDAEPMGPLAMTPLQLRTGEVQARFLAERGHRLIGYAYPVDDAVRAFAVPRLEGVRGVCAELRLPDPLVCTVDPSVSATEHVVTWRNQGVTGVCAYNDDVAFAILSGLRDLGLTAPGDLAVIGTDDIPSARHASPPLTTVSSRADELAKHVASSLVRRLKRETPPAGLPDDVVAVIERESA